MFLTRESFSKAVPRPYEDIEVPELGGTVRVLGLTVAERSRFEMDCAVGKGAKKEMREVREKLLVLSLADGSNTRLLQDEDRGSLGNLPAAVLERLFDAARRLSGMTKADVEELGNDSNGAPRAEPASN